MSPAKKLRAFTGLRPASSESFAEVSREYLAHQKPRISPANYKREQGIIEGHLKPFFAGELKAVRRASIERYITRRGGEEASAGTIIKELNVLKHMLHLSVWRSVASTKDA